MARINQMNKVSKLLLTAALTFAQQQAMADDKLPVWELTGTDNRVFLLGSVHFLRDSDYPLPSGVMAAYELSDHLIMELDMDDLNPIAAQTAMTSMGMNQDGRTLDQILGAKEYAATINRAEQLGLPAAMLQSFEPWFAALTLTQLQMMALGFDPTWGIESQMLVRAQADGKEITGLETMAEQLGFLDRLDGDTQAIFLMQSLEETDKIQESLDLMIAAWRSGDEGGMADIFLDDMREAPALFDALLVQRNRSWIDDIRALRNRDENYLVIVGALHLVGDDSVIAMLEDAGIEAEQLSNNDFN